MIDHGHGLPTLMGLNIALAVTAQIGAVLFLRLAAPQINQ
jgi:ABC-type enterobactin transport system permease subunit